MKEPILKAVAMPPRIIWAPMFLALGNFAVQLPIMMMLTSVINPLFFVATIAIVHSFLVSIGNKEPHISKMMQAKGFFWKSYKSVYPVVGVKLNS